MREYILDQSQSRLPYGTFSMLVRVVKNWRARRQLRQLASLDDYLLKDIGLSRGEISEMRRMPLTMDMQWEADRLRLIASRSGGRVD
ncbi:MAG: DUF1127 domain-containing protein [Rhizobiales bacterium]|nr:DUF1127 domain-containing protein [Hyphomicrobiales bacterium]